jgi:putative ABC transport system permease protein
LNKIILLANANIRKAKGQTAILAALFLISSMMLNIGLTVMLSFGSFFDRTAEELNASDTYFAIPEAFYSDEMDRYFQSESTEFQKNSGIVAGVSYEWKSEMLNNDYITISNKDEARELSQWKLVGNSIPETPDAIYLPYTYNVVGGYNLGDPFIITKNGQTFAFTVAGYIENVFFDNMGLPETFFVPDARFQALAETFPENRKVLVYANGIEYVTKAEAALKDMSPPSIYGDDASFLFSTDYSTVKTNRTSMASMMSAMLIIFTVVIVLVCLLVIRFRISNSIEEDIANIGSLQSIGYTSRQVTLSMMTQYGVIALLTCLAGILPAYLALPFVGDVFAQQSGLYWEAGFEPVINLAAAVSLTLVVIATAFIAALKIRKISPVQALRGGIMTHSFKKNHIPLEKSNMPLTLALSCKSVLQGAKQSLTMLVILTAVSFTAVIAILLYYNSAVDLSTFEKVPGIERANAGLVFKHGEDTEALQAEVLAHKDVYKAHYQENSSTVVDDMDVGMIVTEDYAARETQNVYQGIFPRYDNEIAIAGLLADILGKEIGDEVLVGREQRPFLITGFTQGMESGSLTVYLTFDGIRTINPEFAETTLMIYLNKGTDAAVFAAEMETRYAGRTHAVIDGDASFAEGVSSFASIISLVGLAIVIVAGFVIILVLYFVIGSAVIRRRRELGIQKAIGYTTGNLMNQITLCFALPLTLGAVAGCFLGAVGMNPLMSVGMSPLGVMRADYLIPMSWIIATGIVMVVLSYLTSMLITWRIRKISAYALVTE